MSGFLGKLFGSGPDVDNFPNFVDWMLANDPHIVGSEGYGVHVKSGLSAIHQYLMDRHHEIIRSDYDRNSQFTDELGCALQTSLLCADGNDDRIEPEKAYKLANGLQVILRIHGYYILKKFGREPRLPPTNESLSQTINAPSVNSGVGISQLCAALRCSLARNLNPQSNIILHSIPDNKSTKFIVDESGRRDIAPIVGLAFALTREARLLNESHGNGAGDALIRIWTDVLSNTEFLDLLVDLSGRVTSDALKTIGIDGFLYSNVGAYDWAMQYNRLCDRLINA